MPKIIRDGQGRPFVLGETIGQGSFGKVYEALPEDGRGPSIVAKLPFSQEEIGRQDSAFNAQAAEICARLVREQQRCLDRLPEHLRPQTYGIVDGGGAIPCLLMERLPESAGAPFAEAHHILDLLMGMAAICRALTPLHEAGIAHGNLKPGNVFILGEGEVRFTDPAPESPRLLYRAADILPGWGARMPPELHAGLVGGADLTTTQRTAPALTSPAIDTYGLGKLFYQGITTPQALKDARFGEDLFKGPLTPDALEPFTAALEARFERDKGNPHTRERFLRRTQALMARLLSEETSPSPPYRFYRAEDLAQRFEDLATLFHPGFEQMGPILLDRATGQETFMEGEPVVFSLSFKCQGGLKNPDLLNCFIYVRDLDKEEKVQDLTQEVLPVHDGDRFRCEFTLTGFAPGRFLVRVGMGLKGTPGKPVPRDVLVLVEPNPDARPEPPAATPSPPATPRPTFTAPSPDPTSAELLRTTGGRLLSPAPIQPFEPPPEEQERPSPQGADAPRGGGPVIRPPLGGRPVAPSPGQGPGAAGPRVASASGLGSPVARPPAPAAGEADAGDDDAGQGEAEARSPAEREAEEAAEFYLRGRGGLDGGAEPSSLSPFLSNRVLIGLGALLLVLVALIWGWMT